MNDDEAQERRRLMAGLARRTTAEPDGFFVGWALENYRRERVMDRASLAAWLETDMATLARLAVCRRPTPAQQDYRARVEGLAAHYAIPQMKLAMLLRRAETVLAATANSYGVGLIAARDHDAEDDGAQDSVGDEND